MKHLIIFLVTIFSLSVISCEKEVGGCMDPYAINYSPNADFADNGLCQYDCSCGIITKDGIDSSTNCYWLEIRNYCSNNTKRFCFSYDVWFNNYVGNHFCVTNVSSW